MNRYFRILHRQSASFSIFFIAIIIGISHQTLWAQNGADSPNDLLKRSAEIIKSKDFKKFGELYLPTDHAEIGEVESLISVMELAPEIDSFLEKGKNKFPDDFSDALSYTEFILTGFSKLPDDEAALLSGKINLHGDTAEAVVEYSGKAGNSGKIKMSQRHTMLRHNNRWFFSTPENLSDMKKIYKALKEFVTKGTAALENATNGEQLKTEFGKLRIIFKGI